MSAPPVSTCAFDAQAATDRLRAKNARATLTWLAETPSTNTLAMEAAENGASEFSWFVADKQLAGRGRLGRTWVSPAGRNLYASCIVRPRVTPALAPQLALAAALAVQRAVSMCGIASQIKWPNDIWSHGKKLAGILCEVKAEPDRVDAIIVGVGINVGMAAAEFPPELRDVATSLAAEGSQADRTDVFTALATALEAVLAEYAGGGFAALRDEYNAACLLRGKHAEIIFGEQTLSGIVAGIDADGFLLLNTGHGVERIVAGDVTVKK